MGVLSENLRNCVPNTQVKITVATIQHLEMNTSIFEKFVGSIVSYDK